MTSPASTSKKSAWVPWVLWSTAVLPLFLAVTLYFTKSWAPMGRVNEGELYVPPLVLEKMPIMDLENRSLNLVEEGKWQLILVADKYQEDTLKDSLHWFRQFHKTLGKYQSRVERNLLVLDRQGLPESVIKEYPNLRVVTADKKDFELLLQDIPSSAKPFIQPGILVCDPLGNIMLGYTLDQLGKPMLKDLKKLLKLSNIG